MSFNCSDVDKMQREMLNGRDGDVYVIYEENYAYTLDVTWDDVIVLPLGTTKEEAIQYMHDHCEPLPEDEDGWCRYYVLYCNSWVDGGFEPYYIDAVTDFRE